ncbi:MAG: two component transcriptional regulator, LytTR family, partial [Clostridiales bacterium]|nr:two component transcriptional regulator, LytTR family [Clostridiales bacterium]
DYLSKYTLTELETKLDPNIFFRCHRNFIVNLYKIKQVDPWFNNTYQLTMNDKNKTLVPISRNRAKSIKCILDI